MRDGGYYAIKGFDYQIDKTILEIVSCNDENTPISIEQIQDINADNFVMQVKYRETQSFLPSKVKAPIIQLINEFIKCADSDHRVYYLYCYFLDKDEGEHVLTLDYLNQILGNKRNQFSEEVKKQFISTFVLIFSPDFQAQFSKVIEQIKTIFGCNTHEEAVVHYSAIVRELRAVVVANTDPAKRVFTKQQLIKFISNNKKVVFESGLAQLMDETRRFKLVQSNFKKLRKSHANYIFLGNIEPDTSMSLEKLVIDFVADYYTKATRDIVPPTLIISDDYISDVKKELIRKEVIFNDGYESIQFSYGIFKAAPIVNAKRIGKKVTDSLSAISYKIRLIAMSTYTNIAAHDPVPDMVYVFNMPNGVHVPEGVPTLAIDCLRTKQIYELLK